MIAAARLAAFLLLFPLTARAEPLAPNPACDLAAPAGTLPRLEAALSTRELSMLVLAPAAQSPAGADTGQDDGSLPFRVQTALREQRPDLAIDLDTIDNTGLSIADVMPILADRLAQHPAALVIWQAGTAEIARGDPPAPVSASLADAVRLVAAGGADLILVDPDPDPGLQSQPDFLPIETALVQASAHRGVALYPQNSFGAAATPACTSHGIAHLITHS